ncbi:hypothetical protein [Candidatus Regiella endosymbiont of Tuberolachnus salignus]|uniref:hypothetical protein n=1 Tax=Candidatus Regiella endosymbiont of Tuberolachnus salignus TaxID=3077956 RepID=UPI0030D2CA5D
MPIVQTGTKQSVAMTSTQTNTQKPTATACTRELIQVANDQVTNAEPLLNFKGSETLPQLSTESQRNYRIFPENNESILEHPDASESKVDDGNFEISDDCGAEKDELIRPYYKSKVTSLPISISPSILEETKETMVKEVNPDGIAVWWLRPIAWIGARLGYHGIGQSNCSSCSVAVADSLKIGQLCRADPTLRGGCQRYFRLTTFCYFKMSSFC